MAFPDSLLDAQKVQLFTTNRQGFVADQWENCYGEQWGSAITPEATGHPAKYSRALIRRIYQHIVDEGWAQPGAVVMDPFAGAGLGALQAMKHSLAWFGIELEVRFVDCAAGCDCTGISKVDWVRFQGRWDKVSHKDGRHWCPRCLAQAKQIVDPLPQPTLFDPRPPSAAYERNSGRIPATEPHHYQGNIERWRTWGLPGTATVVQGDSRELLAALGRVDNCCLDISSLSHYNGNQEVTDDENASDRRALQIVPRRDVYVRDSREIQLCPCRSPGEIQESRIINTIESRSGTPSVCDRPSPGHSIQRPRSLQLEGRQGAQAVPHEEAEGTMRQLRNPREPGLPSHQLRPLRRQAREPSGFVRELSHEPPQTGVLGRGENRKGTTAIERPDRLARGITGQLAAMPATGFAEAVDMVASSPPWAQTEGRHSADKYRDPERVAADMERRYKNGSWKGHSASKEAILQNLQRQNERTYGKSTGQLGTETGTTFWSAARTILEQTYAALRPGGHAVWVVKAFCRSGEVVDFPGQWRQLCESVGFVTLHRHNALLTEDRGAQWGWNGELEPELERRSVKRSSFFRKLYERKYPQNAINEEVVWCTVKPS